MHKNKKRREHGELELVAECGSGDWNTRVATTIIADGGYFVGGDDNDDAALSR